MGFKVLLLFFGCVRLCRACWIKKTGLLWCHDALALVDCVLSMAFSHLAVLMLAGHSWHGSRQSLDWISGNSMLLTCTGCVPGRLEGRDLVGEESNLDVPWARPASSGEKARKLLGGDSIQLTSALCTSIHLFISFMGFQDFFSIFLFRINSIICFILSLPALEM